MTNSGGILLGTHIKIFSPGSMDGPKSLVSVISILSF